MRKFILILLIITAISACNFFKRGQVSPKPNKSYMFKINPSVVNRLNGIAIEGNKFLNIDAINNKVDVFEIEENEDTLKLIKTVYLDSKDFLCFAGFVGDSVVLGYENKITIGSREIKLSNANQLQYDRIYAVFPPKIDDNILYIENNCIECFANPLTVERLTPEIQIDISSGNVSTVNYEIPIATSEGSYFLRDDMYCSRTILNKTHFFTIENSAKIFSFNTTTGKTSSKNILSKNQSAAFCDCGENDTADYVSYLLDNNVCSPGYYSITANEDNNIIFRLFHKEQQLYKKDGKKNTLNNRDVFLQVIDSNLNLLNEIYIGKNTNGVYIQTSSNKIRFLNLINNENGQFIKMDTYRFDKNSSDFFL